MDNKNIRPTFGVTLPQSNKTEDKRPECGAIWEKLSKNNKTFLNIKLNLPKSKLLQLLALANGEDVSLNLVAFSNDTKQVGDSRPSFRIYEELKK